MSFWDNVLGGNVAPPAPRTPAYPQPATLGYPQTPGGYSQVPVGYPQVPQGYPQQPVEDPAITSAKQKAPSSRSTRTCPECTSGNLFKPQGQSAARCFDCGWNEAGIHGTISLGYVEKSMDVQAARQVSTAGNFNPQNFDPATGGAGRIG